MKLKYIAILFLLFPLFQLNGQFFKEIDNINVDSLRSILPELTGAEKIDAMNKIAIDMSKSDPDSSMEIANKAKTLAAAMDYQKGIADAFLNNGRNFLYKDSLKQTFSNFLNALRIYENLSPCVEMGITLDYLSFMNMFAGRFDKAKAYAKQEQKVFKQLSNRRNEILATITIGVSFTPTGEFDSAFYYTNLALDLLSRYPDTTHLIAANGNMLNLSLDKFDQDPGYRELVSQNIKNGLKALEIYKAIQSPNLDYLDLGLGAYLNLARAYTQIALSKDSLKMGLEYLESANRLADSLNHFTGKINIYYILGEMKYKEGDYLGSINTFIKGLKEAEESYNKHSILYDDPLTIRLNIYYYKSYIKLIYNYLYYIYDQLGDYHKALEYYILKEKVASEIYREDIKTMVAMLEAESENEQVEKRISLLESDKQINELKVVQTRNLNIGIIVVFVILLLVGILFLRQNKLKNEHKSTLLEQKLLRLQMNPHFIFNALSSIHSLMNPRDVNKASDYLGNFSRLLRSSLESSREDYILLEEEISSLKNYLELQQLRYEKKFEYKIDVDLKIDLESAILPPMLLQPFIENAIEHGIKHKEAKGHIRIRFKLENKKLTCEIEDDGVGREKAWEVEYAKKGKHKSLATEILRDRIKILNKKLKQNINLSIIDKQTETNQSIGTLVKLDLPYLID